MNSKKNICFNPVLFIMKLLQIVSKLVIIHKFSNFLYALCFPTVIVFFCLCWCSPQQRRLHGVITCNRSAGLDELRANAEPPTHLSLVITPTTASTVLISIYWLIKERKQEPLVTFILTTYAMFLLYRIYRVL